MTALQVQSAAELPALISQVVEETETAYKRLVSLGQDGIHIFERIKFEQIGRHPLENRDLNLIEQVNQTFTYLVSFAAGIQLFELYPELTGLNFNLGARRGYDIESIAPNYVVAETFASVRPSNNRKLSEDREKMHKSSAEHKYVFFYSPGYSPGQH